MSDDVPSVSTTTHAWSETRRCDPPKRHATERIGDFEEIYGSFDETAAREQAARCVQCPEPMCVAGCPLQLDIPQWLGLVADGHFFEAASALHENGSLPEICLRMCPADRLCEAMCVIAGRADPVAIWGIEHFLVRCGGAYGLTANLVAPARGSRIAVLGNGPGGLACASDLVGRGHGVTVFDSCDPEARVAEIAPSFRLNPSIVRRRLAILRQQGVEFRIVPQFPQAMTLPSLEGTFAAVYLALDACQPRELDIMGRQLAGVAQARAFIQRHGGSAACAGSPFDVRGKRVVVIGGGDTAVDCLRTALRCGARQAIGVYRREEENMPCTRREYESAIEEGAVYAFASAPIAMLGDARRDVCGVRFARTSPGEPEMDGRPSVLLRLGMQHEIETDFVFLALGYEFDPLTGCRLLEPFNRTHNGQLTVDADQVTNRPGVFAGGDLVRGPCMPLHAMRDARRAALAIDRYVSAAEGKRGSEHGPFV